MGLIPMSGISPGVGNGNLLEYSCLENTMDRGAWQAAVHRVAQSWTGPKPLSSSSSSLNLLICSLVLRQCPGLQLHCCQQMSHRVPGPPRPNLTGNTSSVSITIPAVPEDSFYLQIQPVSIDYLLCTKDGSFKMGSIPLSMILKGTHFIMCSTSPIMKVHLPSEWG